MEVNMERIAEIKKIDIDLGEKIAMILGENEITFLDVESQGLGILKVSIIWGDWKHEHARLDWFMTEILGAKLIGSRKTDDGESDCYSADHYYIVRVSEYDSEEA